MRTDLPGRRTWRVLLALPLVIPSYVGAYLYVSALGPRGLLQGLLAPLGVERLPSIYGFPGALLAVTAFSYPFVLLPAQAALARIDPALEEAARSLGLGPRETLRRVVLPQLWPALAAGGLLVALYALRDFGAVSIMRYDTFTRVIYLQYQTLLDRESTALLSLALVALVALFLWLEARVRPHRRLHRASARSARPAQPLPLGRWRLPAQLFCTAVAGVALVLPTGLLAYWIVRGLRQQPALESARGLAAAGLAEAAWSSAIAAGGAALLTLGAALPIAWLSVRRPGPASRALERVGHLGFALPGIVVALALVFFGVRFARPLYLTLPLLLAAYVTLFLPQAVGGARTSLLQVQPRLEECARSLGLGPSAVARRVTLPLVAPGLAIGAALVFLTAMKELPATLILAPPGFATLATRLWSQVSEAYFARAALPALLIVLLSSVPAAWITLHAEPRRRGPR